LVDRIQSRSHGSYEEAEEKLRKVKENQEEPLSVKI